jgi:ABC-type dipeptide/oligopeptide/nickel transport system ATPase component
MAGGDADRPLLRARGVRVDYPLRGGVVHAVEGFDLDVAEGEIVGIIGETGSGKSTAALALLGMVRAAGRVAAGTVHYRGTDMLGAPEEELRRIRGREIGLVVQNPRAALNPLCRIGDQIAHACRAHRELTRKQAHAEAIGALESVGISDAGRRWRAYPHELSGGMAQRAMIAIATVNRPRVVIADEPTTALDVTVQAQILTLLRDRVLGTGASAVLVTHDLGVIAQFCDRAIVMYHGRVVESATVAELFARPGDEYSQRLIGAAPKLEWVRM